MGEVREESEADRAGLDQEVAQLLTEEEQDEQEEQLEHVMARHVKGSKAWLFASILITLFIALISAVMTNSSMAYAFLGFGPTLLCVLIYIGLLEGEFKDVLFWLTPLVVCFLFLVLGTSLNSMIGDQLDIPVLTGVNLILAYVILAIMSLIEYQGEKQATLAELDEFKPEELHRYIHTIEDKCKALNFVIGRVYRASNGGTKEMREQIKVPSEWYNEFNAIPPDEAKEQSHKAIELLQRIQERLHSLLKPEKDVFVHEDIKGLKNLERDGHGKDRILDVLSVNDSDPVEDYYLGAMDFCSRITSELKKL